METVSGAVDIRVSSWTLATGTQPGHRRVLAVPTRRALRTVAVISTQPHPSHVLDSLINGGNYDVVFVESTARAYSRIKRVTPDLVVLCLLIDDMEAYHLLSMLQLDRATSSIPVMTYEMGGDRTLAVRMH